MPSDRNFPKNILPDFKLGARFCYFLDLNFPSFNSYQNKPLTEHKQALANKAASGLNAPIASNLINPNSDNIQTAINFLKQVAENERNKEIAAVEHYIDHLSSVLPSKIMQKYPDLKILIQELKDFSANPNSHNMKDFYTKLIICLNTIRNTFNDFSNRISNIIKHNNETMNDLMRDESSFRTGSDIDTILASAIGISTKRKEDSFLSKVESLLIGFLEKNLNNGKIPLNIDILSVLVALITDFEHYLQSQLTNGEILSDIDQNRLEQIFNQWETTSPTYLLQCLDNNMTAFEEIIQQIGNFMGFEEILPDSKDGLKRAKDIKNRATRKNNNNQYNNKGRRMLKEITNGSLLKKIEYKDWIHFDIKNGRHGTIYEMIQTVIGPSLKVEGHAATDTISVNIGTINGDISPQFQNSIMDAVKELKKYIEDFEKLNRKDRLDSLIPEFKQMNQNMYNILKKLDIKLEGIGELFIYHESLKLYAQVEEGKTKGFHGRELQILNLLDRLYSISGLGGLTLPDQRIFYNLAINLAENAIGGALIPTVENYLSIFTGMLMFDDIQNMAMELASNATQQIQYSNINNIHMYLLNTIYVPGSYLLTSISEALQMGYNQIASQTEARAKINSSAANNTINTYIYPYGSGQYSIYEWPNAANDVAKGITVQIIFLKSFADLIQTINSYI